MSELAARPAYVMTLRPLSLRYKFILYLLCTHLLFASVAVFLLANNRLWLFAIEAVFLVSLALGIRLIRTLFDTLELINTGAQFIEDQDFTTRFLPVGQIELDRLIAVYNRMVDGLRDERQRLQEQNYFLARVLAVSPSGVITFDFDARIATVNPAAEKLLQLPASQLLGKKLAALPLPFAQSLAEVLTGEARVLPLIGRRRAKCQRAQFLDRGFTRDVLLIEELTEELRQTEKTAYEKIIRLMSHEVNNSVGSANSLLHSCLFYAEQLTDEDCRDFVQALQVVIARTEHLNQFMRSFANVFRLPLPAKQPCDIRALWEQVVSLFKTELNQRAITVVWDEQAQLAPLSLDPRQMEQVFINIFKNALEAIKATPGDLPGTITLRFGQQQQRSFVIIEDTGCGLNDETRAHLFTPFFSTKEHGQGIGLTLVQEILDQHGCEFALESKADEPTRFTIWFGGSLS
jgi:two-component system, NtrC family, nitrogen regulation sensor histidine kinase NtrY